MNDSHGAKPWRIVLLTLLLMATLQPAWGQDDDEEPVVAASGNKMQTDSLSNNTFGFFTVFPDESSLEGFVELPVMGRAKVGENNSAIPQDRFYFVYKYFHNSLETKYTDDLGGTFGSPPTPTERDFSVSRYNVGMEKTFLDGIWSVELRLPMIGHTSYNDANFSEEFGSIGNLSVIFKRLVYFTPTVAWSAGLGVSAPTGADAQVQLGDDLFTFENEAAHLLPFVGFLSAPSQRWFCQGFVQLDIPTNSNSLLAENTGSSDAPLDVGSIRDQYLLYVDLSAGYNLYQNPTAPVITGLTPAINLHYTTSLETTDIIMGSTYLMNYTEFIHGNPAYRFDVINVGAGLYTTWRNRVTTYTGVVAPVDRDTNRFFDMEAQMSVNFNY